MQLINVMAASLDGKIAATSLENDQRRQQVGISSEADHHFLRQQIESADAIVVGASSIRANGSCLPYRSTKASRPIWAIFARTQIPSSAPFWAQHDIERWLISSENLTLPASAKGICRQYRFPAEELAEQTLKSLEHQGCQKVLLFGGGIINEMFYRAGLVDRLLITVAPVMVANDNAPRLLNGNRSTPIQLKLEGVNREDDHLFLDYSIEKDSRY